MKKIPLTQGKFALVDDEDYDFLIQWKWYAAKTQNNWYAHRGFRENGKVKTIKMHRLILAVTDPKKLVDHKNHNTLDNRKKNLRECTKKENTRNRRSIKGSSSKYLGVSKRTNKYGLNYWDATIRVDGLLKYLGYFPYTPTGEKAAAKAYDEAAKKYHGEFANLNFK